MTDIATRTMKEIAKYQIAVEVTDAVSGVLIFRRYYHSVNYARGAARQVCAGIPEAILHDSSNDPGEYRGRLIKVVTKDSEDIVGYIPAS